MNIDARAEKKNIWQARPSNIYFHRGIGERSAIWVYIRGAHVGTVRVRVHIWETQGALIRFSSNETFK